MYTYLSQSKKFLRCRNKLTSYRQNYSPSHANRVLHIDHTTELAKNSYPLLYETWRSIEHNTLRPTVLVLYQICAPHVKNDQ